jgi:hypothetical protein
MSVKREQLTVSTRAEEQNDVTFRATIYEGHGTAISLEGDVSVTLDRIAVSPSREKSDCGISLEFERTSEHDTHLASMFVISPEDERRLVEWLHRHDANYVIETPEQQAESLESAKHRGQCANCGEYFTASDDWSIMERGDDATLYYCDEACFMVGR